MTLKVNIKKLYSTCICVEVPEDEDIAKVRGVLSGVEGYLSEEGREFYLDIIDNDTNDLTDQAIVIVGRVEDAAPSAICWTSNN